MDLGHYRHRYSSAGPADCALTSQNQNRGEYIAPYIPLCRLIVISPLLPPPPIWLGFAGHFCLCFTLSAPHKKTEPSGSVVVYSSSSKRYLIRIPG